MSSNNPLQGQGAAGGRQRPPAPVRGLPDALIDQIAAGEVVERPASVVKELVENALDAGAGRIRVEIRGGGRDWIAVADDGSGMRPEDARRALERHATSKIATAADLGQIATYGFRGEALPAIASVSRLRLRTRPHGAALGFELRCEAGRLLEARESGGAEGTRVEVADLFANVPARRKFLKTVATEWSHSADWLARAALALPAVHFDIRRDDRPAWVWPAAADPLDRVAAVVSEEDAAAFVPVAAEEGAATLEGFVSRPDRHRSTMAGIYLFVNRRPVRDRMLQHALVDVYREVLPRGRFPAAVLFLTVPPDAVDVNVHPAKWEVRFVDPRAIHRLVRHAVRATLGERRWIATGAAAPETGARGAPPRAAAEPASPGGEWRSVPRPTGADDWLFAQRSSMAPPSTSEPGALPVEAAAPLRFGDLRLLGQFLATYLVLETKAGLLLVDQHAAHERVLYERLRGEWGERAVESQGLLVPVTVPLDPARMAALAERVEDTARLGFELEPFGEDTEVVRAVPALLADRDPATLVRDLADALSTSVALGTAGGALTPGLEPADRIFATLACHSARRKGDRLERAEQQALLDALDAIPWAPTCPHGRPVAVPLALDEIERRFARR